MIAVLGLAPERIETSLRLGAGISNFNGPTQTIVSGSTEAIEASTIALKEAGAKRVIPLRVSGPFHSTCMTEASEQFRETVQALDLRPPEIRFVSSVSGRPESDVPRIRELLWRQIAAAVRWTDVMLCVGDTEAVEVGPGSVLGGLAKRTPGGPKVRPAGKLEMAEQLLAAG